MENNVLVMNWDVEIVQEGDSDYPKEYVGTGVWFYKHKNGLMEII